MNLNLSKVNVIQVSNRILLGLLMLVAGILKLFVTTPEGVKNMLTGIGFPIAIFFAWLLIIAEIVSGILIISNWKIKYVVFLPVIILLVATFTVTWGKWTNVIMHLILVSNYLLIAYACKMDSK